MSCVDDVVAAIEEARGSIRFDQYMEIALYGEHGFYTAGGGRAGRRGDFITSPEVGPLFGAVLANWIESEWQRQREPDDFTIVECGAGPGTLARSILAAAPQWRDRYVAVEPSAAQRASHPAGVVSVAELPKGPSSGVVIANELLDNLPFRLVVFDGGWREVGLVAGRDGELAEITMPPDPAWEWLPRTAPHGARLPIQEAAAAWVSMASRLLRRGPVLAVDYCTMTTADLSRRPWREWLRTYRGHDRGEHYLRGPGEQDITAQVCVDQLPHPTMVATQADFLRLWGIEQLVEQGHEAWNVAASNPDVQALRMRSRVSEAEALLDPTALGAFTALCWTGGQH